MGRVEFARNLQGRSPACSARALLKAIEGNDWSNPAINASS
jgi:hypothetical protein